MLTTGHRILVLEDDANRIEVFREVLGGKHAVSYVETAHDCIELLEREKFDILFLDHDLGGLVYVSEANTNTGSEVVRWLKLHIQDLNPYIIVHSHNHVAAERMEQDLKRAAFSHVYRIPFGELCKRHFNDPSFLS
jgi:CheY-like chemotaxis protein